MAVLDPLKYEVFYQKIDKILNEAKEVLRYLSASMITREAGEVQVAFYLPNGEAAHIAAGIFMHIMNVTRVIRYMNANRYDADDIGIYDGDQFINNDAYIGGMHCPDTAVVAPVFHKGRLIGYVAAISHTTETGAIEPGGMCPSSRESIHDGIHLPAVKLIDRGKMRRDVLNMIFRQVRDSTAVELDIRARIAGNERARRRLMELIDEVGLPFFEAACKKLVDDAEAYARARIKSLKPGIYRARVFEDCSGLEEKLSTIEVEVETAVTKDGTLLIRIPVVSPEGRHFNNAYIPAVEATVFYTLLSTLLYDCRWNSGLSRAMKIEYVPENSRLSASPRAAVGYATVGITAVFCNALMDILSRALYIAGREKDVMGAPVPMNSQALGGINQYGGVFVQGITSKTMAAGGGARIDGDGMDSSVTVFNPWTYVNDAESEEFLMPMIHVTSKHRPDSGGFGKFRGGSGVEHINMIHGSNSTSLIHYGCGRKVPVQQGLFGGYPGCSSYFYWMLNTDMYEVIDKQLEIPFEVEQVPQFLSGEYISSPPTVPARDLKSGDMWVASSHGGGAGLGDPIEREPALIIKDIENRIASLEVAQKVFCVAINPKTLEVDYKETKKLREERRRERLERGEPGIKYLKRIVDARKEKRLPKVVLDFFNETEKFCPTFKMEFDREKEITEKGLQYIGKVGTREKLLSLTPYVDIVIDEKGRRLAVCSKCGFVYCEANNNFKLYCLVYEREPSDFWPGRLGYDKDWCIFREFYCPSCASQVEVEAVPPGSPIIHNYELKL